MKDQVLDFINKFKFKHARQLEQVFTSGNCYYFAVILRDRFNGQIYYLPSANHFVCKVNNNYYDIEGEAHMNEQPFQWLKYRILYPTLSEKIIRDCISFESRKN